MRTLFQCVGWTFALASIASGQISGTDQFETKIRPILASRCYACHSSALPTPQGGLTLDTVAGIRKGGNSGALFEAGEPSRSLLMRVLSHTGKAPKMPPGAPLPPQTIEEIRQWLQAGASLPQDRVLPTAEKSQLWSLKRPAMPPGPASGPAKAIDAFIQAALQAKGLSPSPEADKRTLIRRLSYDLTGLPPTWAEVNQFTDDQRPDAYERLVDRLLASPRYGERWGRHWLDIARYADSFNDSVNTGQRYPWSYSYRDWVIRAFNDDLPYDQFLLYQLAADRLPDADRRHLAALGFLSLGREFPNSYPETVDDRIDAVTRGMLGLTVSCARCHDHKYDPIPTKDYYSLYSVFSAIRPPKDLPELQDHAAPTARQKVYEGRLSTIEKEFAAYRSRRNAEMVTFFKSQVADYLIAAHDSAELTNSEIEELVRDRQLNLHVLSRWRKYLAESKKTSEPVFRMWHAAAAGQPGKSSEDVNPLMAAEIKEKAPDSLRKLAEIYASVLAKYDRSEAFGESAAEQLREVMRGPASPVDIPVEQFELIFTEGDSNNSRAFRVRYNAMLVQSAYDGAPARAMAVEDVSDPPQAHVFLRGNPNNPGAEVYPHFLSCLGGSDKQRFQDRRLDLARAIIDPANPLTARVMVNRVWMYHFGQGLVRTPSDFGFRGDPPTHPELLDYLAVRFMESGWSVKKLHKLILMSATYRQSSADNEAARRVDPENQLVWRMNRRRLDFESLRDSMLVATGRLENQIGVLPFSLTAIPFVPRRSVYGFIERGRVPSVLNAFDFASPDQHAPMRYVTTVPQQALFFMNSPFVAEQARQTASRPEVAGQSDASHKIAALYRILFARDPEAHETEAAIQFVNPAEKNQSPSPPASAWQYGTTDGKSFAPFATFTGEQWQGSAELLDKRSGKAVLTATGGEPGEQADQSVARRWVSPSAGRVAIEGTLRHGQGAVPYGDGVRGRIVSSRHGEIASWVVNGSSAETKMNGISVEVGDTLDFLVDARSDVENDPFGWVPVISMDGKTWNARNDFAGPAPAPLDMWARYVQVLLQTNEFAFVD